MKVKHLISLLKQYKLDQEVKAIGLGSASVDIYNVTSSTFEKNYDICIDERKEIVYIKLNMLGI